MSRFQKNSVVSEEYFREITNIRVSRPGYILETAQKRKRRKEFVPNGRMNIVAADHPARGSVSVGNDPFAMADRHGLLARWYTPFSRNGLTGFWGAWISSKS
jgi:hypothetical protein